VQFQTGLLLRRFATEATRTARAADADSIHDLRVSIRRLSRCLRVFAQFYPAGSWKPVRRRLADLMHLCGSVRDCDIAIELLKQAGVRVTAPLVRQLRGKRRAAAQELQLELQGWKVRSVSRQWRTRLEL
jgi:CHAD domain-containing protein